MNKSFWEDKRVLVIGASGFLGTKLSKRLCEYGAVVIGFEHITPVRYYTEKVFGDVLDSQEKLKAIMRRAEPDVVYYFAAEPLVTECQSVLSPLEVFRVNALGTVNVLSALSDFDVPIIIASTDKVYGRHKELPYTENHCLLGNRQVYEASKLAMDNFCRALYEKGQRIAMVRTANLYGPGDDYLSRLIPHVISSCLNGDKIILRGDGHSYRDYLYIEDAVDAYLFLGDYLFGDDTGAIPSTYAYNFGSGNAHRTLDIVTLIQDVIGTDLDVILLDLQEAKEEIDKQYLDTIHKYFDWTTKVLLKDGIMKTVEYWERKKQGDENARRR